MAAPADVKQLLLQVEASVAVAERNIRQLSRVVQSESNVMDASLKKTEVAHQRLGNSLASAGQYRSGLQQLSFQIGDVTQQMALGQRASVIFMQQAGQVVQAITLMQGGANKFLSFMGGPWGAVLVGAASILLALSTKMKGTSDTVEDLVEKMRKQAAQAELNEQADRAWKSTVEGLTEALKKRREETDKIVQTDISAERASLAAARADLYRAQVQNNYLKQQLPEEERKLEDLRDQARNPVLMDDYGGAEKLVADIAKQEARIEKMKRDIEQAAANLDAAEQLIRRAEMQTIDREVAALGDETKAANDKAEILRTNLKGMFDIGIVSAQYYRAELKRINDELAATIKRINDAKKKTNDPGDLFKFLDPSSGGTTTGTFGEWRGNRAHQGIDKAMRVGSDVFATAAGVAEVANVPGYGNLIIINHGRGTETRYAHLSKFLVKSGDVVAAGQRIGLSGGEAGAPGAGNSTGPHLHYEVRRGGKPVNPGSNGGRFPVDPTKATLAAQRGAERDAARELRQENVYEQASLRLSQELLAAKMDLVSDTRLQADYAKDMVDADLTRRLNAIANAEEEGKLTRVQAIDLTLKEQAVAEQKKQNIEDKKQEQLRKEAAQLQEQLKEGEIAELEFQEEYAKTREDKIRLQKEIADALYQINWNAQQEIIDSKTASAAQKEIARLRQEQLSRERERTHYGIEQQNLSPLERYQQELSDETAKLDDRVEEVFVDGLEHLNSELLAAIQGTKSLGEVFKNVANQIIADLLRIAIQQAIIKPLGQLLGKGLGSLLGSIGGAAAGGSPIAGSTGGFQIGPVTSPGYIPGGATGLWGTIGGRGGTDQNLLSINGRAVARVSRGEDLAIIPKAANVNIPGGGGGRGFSSLTVNVHAEGAVLVDQIRQQVGQGIALAIEGGSELAQGKLIKRARRRIP
jgi:murein DD-endopeptidase MepM/ murein hydrolase activator NlpD